MRHETKLLQLVTNVGLVPKTSKSLESFLNNRVSKLYAEHAEIRNFLIAETSFLPKDETAANRWRYYKAGETKPHVCPTCGKYVPVFDKTYCCLTCANRAPGAKRGPKVDLSAKEAALRRDIKRIDPTYSVVEYGKVRSKFRHSCGNEFWLGNRALLNGTGSCQCLHKKLAEHTLKSLTEWHAQRVTGFTPRRLLGADALLQCNKCRHTFETRKFYDRRCPKCFPNIFASNVVTQEDYRAWLAKNRKSLSLVGTYVNVRTAVLYRHTKCGLTFKAKPGSVARRNFKCPACAPKTCASYRTFKRHGIEMRVRGKENIALDWILRNTTIKLSAISVDSEGTVPRIRFRPSGLRSTKEYKPDFYVASRNLIIEVKDGNTLGVAKRNFFYQTGKQLWSANCAKAKSCIEQGYKFQMLLFDRNNARIALPKHWYNMSHLEIVKWSKTHGVF